MPSYHNLREFGCKLPSSLPSCVREGGSGSGVGVARPVGIWRASRSIVLFGDWPPETSPGGTQQANTSNKTVKSMVPDEKPLEGDRHQHNDFTMDPGGLIFSKKAPVDHLFLRGIASGDLSWSHPVCEYLLGAAL